MERSDETDEEKLRSVMTRREQHDNRNIRSATKKSEMQQTQRPSQPKSLVLRSLVVVFVAVVELRGRGEAATLGRP